MALNSSTFAMIRHIRLDYYLFGERKHHLLYPHSVLSTAKKTNRQTSLLLGSIRFISKHCHMLTSFRFVPNRALWHEPPRPKRARILKALTLALVELVQSCPSFEVVGFEIDFLEVRFSKSGSFAEFPPAEHYGGTNSHHDLNLIHVPQHVLVRIRAEILDILFRLRVIEIKCWPTKSTKLLYRFFIWVNYGKGYGFWDDMVVIRSPFLHLRHIRFPCHCPSDAYPRNEMETPEEMTFKLASSLDDIAQHCTLLMSLVISVPISPCKDLPGVSSEALDAVVKVLANISQRQVLEVVAVMDLGAILKIVEEDGTLNLQKSLSVDTYENVELDLQPYEHTGRGIIISEWAAAVFQEFRFVNKDEYEHMRLKSACLCP
ncbi:hypothetical protein HBI56_147680 [Parastagonospora nodorum]|nr:hypothetical protein HBH52_071660 [Parastagonospora nodorum]KAH4264409.1 hypothetical protein HBI03_088190 [Parastagonospora nodorum]KAH4278696.1 hypothetical protein HBI04_084170 [Parastagonospora nodorum]KAH4349208.1 hypothetical protein HBH98_063800 [Parastagonospora nodorum]KAH4379498.1 hypothetical protein HBH97_097560 [Parastagonospora nodorum]